VTGDLVAGDIAPGCRSRNCEELLTLVCLGETYFHAMVDSHLTDYQLYDIMIA